MSCYRMQGCAIADLLPPALLPPPPLQVEFADVIVLNKTDLVSNEQQQQLQALLRKLNPSAHIVPTSHSQVDVSEVRGRGAGAAAVLLLSSAPAPSGDVVIGRNQ